MGIEELKLVLQTLSGLADGAKEGFIWWLLVTEVFPRLVVIVCIGMVVTLAWKVARLIADYNSAESHMGKALTDIASATGTYIGTQPYCQSDMRKLIEAVHDLKKRAP